MDIDRLSRWVQRVFLFNIYFDFYRGSPLCALLPRVPKLNRHLWK